MGPAQDGTENGLRSAHPLPLPQREAQGPARTQAGTQADRAQGERSVPPPKSPLRVIVNAFRKTLLPSGGKKPWTKAESKALPTNQAHARPRSFSFRRSSSSKEGDQRSPGRDVMNRAAAFFSPSSLAAKAAQATDLSPPGPAQRTHSLPRRPPEVLPHLSSAPGSKLDDVPSLLEKVSLQEPSDALKSPKRIFSLFSSFRIKDKSSESSPQEPKPRKDVRDLFDGPQEKGLPTNGGHSLEKPGQAAQPPPPAGAASSQRIPVRAQVTEASSPPSSTSSSSGDEGSDSELSLQAKENKMLRKRRKLEKATKQLAKQEELKRLHKAQAIQRQLEEVEVRQRASEIQGVRLEKALRGEADSGTQDEAQLLQEWFQLVLEKNKLMRYESELLIMAQELELEDHHSRLQQKYREKMLKEENQKDENALNEAQEIFTEMMKVVEQRDKLVDSLEEQRLKEKAEDQHFESFVFPRGCQLSRT
ncbi:F-actin-monooxygenase MICAL2-like [Lepus europaeus]|uniref:F-actin-monooxygenase MICAL2-like n=1 Tax=Lepus europaeus TaxID=9983 RepID=UPI002B49CA33|nr:F-actin-monooxygenase MICAL2-like [Lepus europaeus]